MINDLEEEILKKQTDMATEKSMLMTIHLPHNNKPKGMKRIERILKKDNEYSRQIILVDRNVEETIEKTLDLGMWAGLISC